MTFAVSGRAASVVMNSAPAAPGFPVGRRTSTSRRAANSDRFCSPAANSFQFPIVYGNFSHPDQFEPDFRIPWGAPVRVADMQGGMGVIRMPDGSLRSVTGSAGNDIYRGHRLPPDLVGDYLYGEPVGRIVRRVRAEKQEGVTRIRNYYDGNEFIKSTDPYFRPVDQTTAPDGTI